MEIRQIEVVAAVIFDGTKILATKRGSGNMAGKWEFPGGKIEPGETHQQALKREIMEELGIIIPLTLSAHNRVRLSGISPYALLPRQDSIRGSATTDT